MRSIDELIDLLRRTEPLGRPVTSPPRFHGEWLYPTDDEWAVIVARAEGNDRESARAANTRVWNPEHNLVGAFGEWVYGREVDLEMNTSTRLGDGGEDFPGVDVKATTHWQSPLLLRLATDPLKAPRYALVAVDLEARRGRYVGWATRQMLESAPSLEYGYGPTRTLGPAELLVGLP